MVPKLSSATKVNEHCSSDRRPQLLGYRWELDDERDRARGGGGDDNADRKAANRAVIGDG